jgi:hypothetical protein
MTIRVRPSDLISRFIWDNYDYFCLDGKSNAEKNKIIENDEEFEISEEDAFVIGLTNVIYTNEVIRKYQQFLRSILENKHFEQDNRKYINRQLLINSIYTFKNKIPKTYTSTSNKFNDELAQLPALYTKFTEGVNNLTTITVQDCPCVKYGQVKKVINKLA